MSVYYSRTFHLAHHFQSPSYSRPTPKKPFQNKTLIRCPLVSSCSRDKTHFPYWLGQPSSRGFHLPLWPHLLSSAHPTKLLAIPKCVILLSHFIYLHMVFSLLELSPPPWNHYMFALYKYMGLCFCLQIGSAAHCCKFHIFVLIYNVLFFWLHSMI